MTPSWYAKHSYWALLESGYVWNCTQLGTDTRCSCVAGWANFLFILWHWSQFWTWQNKPVKIKATPHQHQYSSFTFCYPRPVVLLLDLQWGSVSPFMIPCWSHMAALKHLSSNLLVPDYKTQMFLFLHTRKSWLLLLRLSVRGDSNFRTEVTVPLDTVFTEGRTLFTSE